MFAVIFPEQHATYLHGRIYIRNFSVKLLLPVKKLKHEAELTKAAIEAGVKYAEERGAAIFEPTDSQSEKILYIYRLLVHDRLIQPMPEEQVSQKSMRHRLAIWYSRQLPKDHPLLK